MPKDFNYASRINAEQKIRSNMTPEVKNPDKRMSDVNPVEPARAYGVTRKELYLFEKIKLFLARALVVFMMFCMVSILVTGIIALILHGNELINTVIIGSAAIICLVKFSKPIRRRLKFQRRLKKLCKENNYKLSFEQNFFDSLIWSKDKLDFVLNTGTHVYLVHYLTLTKYNASLSFIDSEHFVYTKHRLKNAFTLIFSLKSKSKSYSVSFPKEYERDRHINIRALVVNPVCKEMFYKNSDGIFEATGSGGDIFGYKVFTGSGFIEAINRNEQEQKRQSANH